MRKFLFSSKMRKFFWCLACAVSLILSFFGSACSLLLLRLALSPIDVSGIGKSLAGGFYLNEVGEFTPRKHKAVGYGTWDRLEISWRRPVFSQWLSHRDLGGIEISLQGLKLFDLSGQERDSLEKVQADIRIKSAFRGKVAPTKIAVSGLALYLKKDPKGRIILDFPGVHAPSKPSKPLDLSFISRKFFTGLEMKNIHLSLEPYQGAKPAIVEIPALKLGTSFEKSDIGQWSGAFKITAQEGGEAAVIEGLKENRQEGSEPLWQIKTSFPALSDFSPVLPVLEKIHFPVETEISGDPVSCALGMKNCRLAVKFKLGSGFYIQPDGTKMRLSHAHGQGSVAWAENYRHVRAEIDPLEVGWIDSAGRPIGETMSAALTLDKLLAPKKTDLAIQGHFPTLHLNALSSLWPQGIANGARTWITENLTQGQVENFRLNVRLASRTGFEHLKLKKMTGGITAHQVTVHWLKDMPPFKGVEVKGDFIDADHVLVTLSGGAISQGKKRKVSLSKGSVAISDISAPRPIQGKIALDLSGDVPLLVNILSRDRLPILKRFRKYYTRPEGKFEGHLLLSLPFAAWVTADDIGFDTKVQASNLGALLKEIGQVKKFNGVLLAKNEALSIRAKALVRNVPVSMVLNEDLNAKKIGQEMLKIHLTSEVNAQNLKTLGLSYPSIEVSGAGAIFAEISQPVTEKDHNQTDLEVRLDMEKAGIHSLLWDKKRGIPAGGSFLAQWKDGDLIYLKEIKAYGPEIKLQAETLMKGKSIEGIDISDLEIGKNKGTVHFEWPMVPDGKENSKKTHQKYILKLQASKLNLEPFLQTTSAEVDASLKEKQAASEGKKSVKKPTKTIMKRAENGRTMLPAGDWDLDLSISEAFLGKGRILGPGIYKASWDKGHLKWLNLKIDKPFYAHFEVFQNKENYKEHLFETDIVNLGGWLSWAKIYHGLYGGKLKIEGKFAPSIILATLSDPLVIQIEKRRKYEKEKKRKKEPLLDSQVAGGKKESGREMMEKSLSATLPSTGKEGQEEAPMTHSEGLGLGLPPYSGKISLSGMRWESSLTGILLAKIFSPYNWVSVNKNLDDISINGTVSLQDGIIGLGNMQGKSDIIDATMEGTLNLNKNKVNLGGTISPNYVWNSTPGHLPSFLGYIFSPEKGSGILAMGYTLDGVLSDPHFNLNPYMLLLPGILRKIANPG